MSRSRDELEKDLKNQQVTRSVDLPNSGRSNKLSQIYQSVYSGQPIPAPEVISESDPNEPIIKEPIDTSNFTLKDHYENLYKKNPNYISGLDNRFLGEEIPEEETPDSSNPFTTAVRGVSRGIGQTAILAGQGILALADAATDAVGFEDAIDSEDGEIIRLLNEAKEYIGHEEGMGGKLAEAIGSMLIYAVPGMGQAGLSARAATAAMKGAQGLKIAKQANKFAKGMSVLKYTTAGGMGAGISDEMMKAYKAAGGEYTTGQKNLSLAVGVAIGFSELLPIEMILKGLPRYLDQNIKNGIIRRIANAVADGGMEGVQEVGASLAQEYSAQMIYNPDQEIGESMLSDFGYGGSAGAIFSLFLRGKNRRIGRTKEDQQRLMDDYDDATPSTPYTENTLPKGKIISLYDTAGDEISGTVNNVDPENNTVSVTINDGADTIDIPLTPEINEQGYSLFSDQQLFNPTNSIDVADKDGNVINYPVGNPDKTSNELLEKEENRLNKLAAKVNISEQDIFKLKVIKRELARREVLTSDTQLNPEQIDTEVNQEAAADEEAQTGSAKFIEDIDNLTERTSEEAEIEAEQRAREGGLDIETGEFISIPKKFSNITFDVPDPDSNVAYDLGKRGKNPSKNEIEKTASDLNMTVDELTQLSNNYAKDVQSEIKKQDKDEGRYKAPSFREYAEQNKPYKLRDKQLNNLKKELKISNNKFKSFISKITGVENKKLEDLNSLQRSELVDLMSQEKQNQKIKKDLPQVKVSAELNNDGDVQIEVKGRADPTEADPLETIILPPDTNIPNKVDELEQKYNIEEGKEVLLNLSNQVDQQVKQSAMDIEYFRALELATENDTINVKSLQKKLFGTGIENINDFKKTQSFLSRMEESKFIGSAKTDKPTSTRKVLQKFSTIDKAGEILVEEVVEEDGQLQDLTETQLQVANKVINIVEGIAPGSQLKLGKTILDKASGKEIFGAQFKNIITVALDGRVDDITNPAYHEATHYLWNNGFFTKEQEQFLLDNRDYLRQIVKQNILGEQKYNQVFSILDKDGEMDELIAYTSGYYNSAMDLGNTPPSFMTEEVSGILNNLYEVFKQLARYLTGNNKLFTPAEAIAIQNILDNIRNGTIGNQSPSFNVDNSNPLARRQAVITGLPDAKYEENNFSLFSPLKRYLKQSQLKQKKKGSEWLSRNEKGVIIGALKKATYKEKGRTYQVTNNELKETGLYNYLIDNPNEIISGQALLNIAKQNESLMIVNIIGEPTNDINYAEVALQEQITLQLKQNLYNYMVTEQPVEILFALNEASKSGAFNNKLLTNMLQKYTNSDGELINGRRTKNYNLEEITEDIVNFNLNANIKIDEVIDRWFNANTQLNKYIGDGIELRKLKDQYSDKSIYDDAFKFSLSPTDFAGFEQEQKQKDTRIIGIKLLTNSALLKPKGIDNIFFANKLMKNYGYNDEFLMSFVETLESLAKTNVKKSTYITSKLLKGISIPTYNVNEIDYSLDPEPFGEMARFVSGGERSQAYKEFTFPGIRGLGIDNYQTVVFSLPNFNQEIRTPDQDVLDEMEFSEFTDNAKGKIVGKNVNVKTFGNANHYDNVANPFGHIRTVDIGLENGDKILIVEEAQNDYAAYIQDELILHLDMKLRLIDKKPAIVAKYKLNLILSQFSWFPIEKQFLISETYRRNYLSESPEQARINVNKEIRNIAREAALSDISGGQVETKKMLKEGNLPELPYLNQNDYLQFMTNYIIQRASREGYDGIAIANSELQNERYRHNFKNSIKGIDFNLITLENKDSKEPNKKAVRFSYTIPSETDRNSYPDEFLLFLNETDLDSDNYNLEREFQNNEDFLYDSKMTFEKFLGKDITEILLNNTDNRHGRTHTINNLPEFIEQNLPEGQTRVDGIDIKGRTDIPVGGAAFRDVYDVIIPKLFINEMKASVPANKRKAFTKEKLYLYTDGVSGFGNIINENEILSQPTIVTDTKEAQVPATGTGDTVSRITSNVTNALRFIPITEEMKLESKDSAPLNTVAKARRMSVINNAKKERNNFSSNIRETVTNFFTNSKIFDPLYGVPEQRDYLLLRGKAMGIFSASERIALKLRRDIAPYLDKNNPLKKKDHTEVRELLFRFLTTNPTGVYTNKKNEKIQGDKTELELYTQLKLINPKMAKAALDSKDIIEKLGQQLVEANIIPANSFEINKRNYLPKLYIAHVIKNPAGDARSYAKKRQQQDDKKEDGLDALGAIDQLAPEFLVSRAIQRPMRDLAMLEFYNSIAGNRQWTLDGDLADVEYDGKKVSFFWLYEQQKQYREIAQYLDREPKRKAKMLKEADDMLVIANQARDRYAEKYDLRPEDIFNQEQNETDPLIAAKIPEGFKRVPNNRLYGLMAGKAVRTGIYEDIISSISYTAWGDNNYVKGGKLARKLTSTWKLIKVPLNPPTVARNMMSNAILMNLSGMPIRRIMSNMYKATNEIIAYKKGDMANSKHYKALLDRGVADTSFTESELFRWAEDFKEFTTERSIKELGILSWLHLKGWQRFANKAASLYQNIEVMGKTAMAIEMMENQNKNADEAYLIAQDALFDYSLVSPTVRGVRTSPVGIPFLTFMYKVTPKLIDVAINNPFRFAPYVAMMYALPQVFMNMFDIDDEDYEKLKALLPQYTNSGTTLPIPMRDSAGRLQFLDLGYIMPWGFGGQLLEQGKKGYNSINGTAQLEEFEATDILQTLGLFGGPGWSLAGLPLNIDPFSKRPIWKEGEPLITDTGSDFNVSIPGLFKKDGKLIDFMQYVTNQFMLPSFLHTEYGATNRMISAINEGGEINDKNKITVLQAAMKFVGLNTFAIDEKQAGYTRLMLTKEINLIIEQRRKMLQNKSYSKEDKLIRVEKFNEEISKIKFKIGLVNEITQLNPDLLRTIRDKN